MICNSFKGKLVLLALALAVLCMGCSGDDDSTTSEQGGDFTQTPEGDIPERIANLKLLLPEEVYNTITDKSRNDPRCRESNRKELGLPDSPNGQWYYTYENLIKGMAELEEFANEGDDNTKKLEIAAFLANIAQETGAGQAMDPKFGGPGCAIQEGYGSKWKDPEYGGLSPQTGAGYAGRGPHQLTHDVNYNAFGKTMDVGDEYLDNPDLLTTDPKIGIAGSIWFWGHEELSTQQGWPSNIPFKPAAHKVLVGTWKPSDADKACGRTKADFGVIINLINGGIECGEGAENPGAAENRVNYLVAIAEEMGVTIPAGFLDNCSTQQNFAKCPSYRDPKSRCGKEWGDADKNCRRCCSSDEDCPDEYPKCFGDLNPTPGGETCTCEN